MATFIDLHQGQQLILINVESVQSVGAIYGCQPGARLFFTDGSQIEVDENVTDIQELV
jgi:hypothetical protein